MDISKAKHIHFVGIKGVGMTALALCALDLGIKVTGSDTEEIFVTDETLQRRGISWNIGFKKENIPSLTDLVVTTGAHGGLGNPEVLAAGEMGIPVLTQAQALGTFMEGKEGISVCGVGGKTTTAAIIATILDRAKLSPSFAIGVGNIFSLGTPGRYDRKGKHFITEADEYAVSPGINNRPRFSFQNPEIVVVTNIEHDHPDIYPNFEMTKRVFLEFFSKIPQEGMLFACLDNKNTKEVIKNLKVPVQTYGLSPESDWWVERISFGQGQTFFGVTHQKISLGEFILKVPGRFNVLNATAAMAVGTFLGLPIKTITQALRDFRGTRRRFEFIGQRGEIELYDDYAHHPTEIRATLGAAREWFGSQTSFPKRRIIALFQPHTYSRTKVLLGDFARAFGQADLVVLADIYASAREKEDPTVSSRLLSVEAQKYHPRVKYGGTMEEIVKFLPRVVESGDVILTLGAGDIFHYHQQILEALG